MGLFSQPLLTGAELKKLADTIAVVEQTTSGEIRIGIHKRRGWAERELSLHELAVRHFYLLGMDKTHDKTGVLVFLSLADRSFQIIADEGIHKRVHTAYWNELADGLTAHFREKRFCDGLCEVVKQIGITLAREFPKKAGDTNELSNDVSIS